MGKLSQFVVAKLLSHKQGFTLVEFILVLTIISLVVFLKVVNHTENLHPTDIESHISLLTSRIDFYQSLAIKQKQPVLLLFRPYHNDMKVQIGHKTPIFISLKPLILSNRSNLDYLQFNSKGQISKFGTLNFTYQHTHFALIFHIEQGRYRISFEN